MSFASHFQASFSGFWGGEFLMQPRYAKVTTLEIDTCLTGRGINSPALAALDDASKNPSRFLFNKPATKESQWYVSFLHVASHLEVRERILLSTKPSSGYV